MPQVQLPVFPAGSQHINAELGFERRDNQVTYFNGHLPVFAHAADDLASFRFFTTQLIVNGTATQGEISRAFVTLARFAMNSTVGALGLFDVATDQGCAHRGRQGLVAVRGVDHDDGGPPAVVTTTSRAQKMVDRPPSTFAAVSAMPCPGANVSFTA